MTRSHPPALVVHDVVKRFGGLVALDQVRLVVPDGAIVGLIGPNGAGKTTLFDCVTGLQTLGRGGGRIVLFGQDVTDWPPHERARLGVARTYQRLELFTGLTVRENVVAAYEARLGRASAWSDLLALPPTVEARAEAEEQTKGVLEATGLDHIADVPAGDLPLGQARTVEFARALVSAPRLLLLDEPNSGLRGDESARVARLVRLARDTYRTAVLVVEHDMGFVLDLVDYVYVLDFGRLLAHGEPAEIRDHPAVQAAYLGQPA